MKADIIVTRYVNDQPPHVHNRGSAKGPASIERAYKSAVAEEYARLERGLADNGSKFTATYEVGLRSRMTLTTGEARTHVVVEAVLR
jgi:hypothetical protein